jgi:7,8-dihydropterin-6-yl-methyl-4-(beta-D-ribofuranosyl)aminobenzene 5'-phosphate synthase
LAVKTIELKEASRIEIISLMDNTIDFLSSNTRKEVQTFWHWTKVQKELPFAEHGFSMLIRVVDGEKSSTILFDTGVSPNGAVRNAKRMGLNLHDVSYVALSHGHYDHFGGLTAVVKAVKKNDLPIIVHEDMVKRRGTANSKGEIREYPTFPKPEELSPAKIVNTKKPQPIAQDLACVTGEIPRTVDFEKGFLLNRIRTDNSWQPDPLVLDERALVFNVKGKGLVIISGCAHAGIINTIRYAQHIAGSAKVYAVLGGFHLAGKEFEKRIQPTVEELKKINPELIVPSHCTGWRAIFAMREAFPEAFVFNSVGNRYLL